MRAALLIRYEYQPPASRRRRGGVNDGDVVVTRVVTGHCNPIVPSPLSVMLPTRALMFTTTEGGAPDLPGREGLGVTGRRALTARAGRVDLLEVARAGIRAEVNMT